MLSYEARICALFSMLNGKVNKTETKAIEYLIRKHDKAVLKLLNDKLKKSPELFEGIIGNNAGNERGLVLARQSKFIGLEDYELTPDGDAINFVWMTTEDDSVGVPWYLVEDD